MTYEVDATKMTREEIIAWVDEIEKVANENNLMDNSVDDMFKNNSRDFAYDVESYIKGIRKIRDTEIVNALVQNLGWWIDFYMTSNHKVKIIYMGNEMEVSNRLASKAVKSGMAVYA